MSLNSSRGLRGQAVVELTFAFLIFITIFLGIVEFSHLLYTKVTLQNALRSAGRYMVTGQTALDGNGNPIPRDQVIHDVFCDNLIAVGVPCPSGSDFQFICIEDDGTTTACSGGGPDDTVMVTVNLSKPALIPFFSQFFPSGGFPFQLHTTWKNEPYA
ncbi:MAG: TadE/TadG family type IV pilus assembly protein [Candidatus Binatia bacterium]